MYFCNWPIFNVFACNCGQYSKYFFKFWPIFSVFACNWSQYTLLWTISVSNIKCVSDFLRGQFTMALTVSVANIFNVLDYHSVLFTTFIWLSQCQIYNILIVFVANIQCVIVSEANIQCVTISVVTNIQYFWCHCGQYSIAFTIIVFSIQYSFLSQWPICNFITVSEASVQLCYCLKGQYAMLLIVYEWPTCYVYVEINKLHIFLNEGSLWLLY